MIEQEHVPGIAARMPRKRVAAGALLRDRQGRVLFVEPTYKPTWDIPGGVVEADEPPLEGCRRELAEELGIPIALGRLLVIDWVPREGPWHDALLFVFDAGLLTPGVLDTVVLPEGELHAVHLMPLHEAAEHLPAALARRLRQAVEVADDETAPTRYLHHGHPAG